jgi:hypothetical protein
VYAYVRVLSADTTFELSWSDGTAPHAIVLTDSQHQQHNGGNNLGPQFTTHTAPVPSAVH